MISEQHNFIFMHIDKTAGTSIETFFGFDKPKGHEQARALKKITGQQWETMFKFTFVRNPWDRFVSMWHHFTRDGRTVQSFDRWIIGAMGHRKELPYTKMCQYEWFQGLHDEFDFVGRFENLQGDFDHICRKIGYKGKTKLPHKLMSVRNHYRQYYKASTRDMVRKEYADDIEMFRYCF